MLTAARLLGYHNITLCDQHPSGQVVYRHLDSHYLSFRCASIFQG